MDLQTELLVVGSGPGGHAAALRAAELGVDTVLVEASRLGGTCLNVGCIPSKAMIHLADAGRPDDLEAARSWKAGVVDVLRRGLETRCGHAGVRVVEGWATLVDGKTAVVATPSGDVRVRARAVVLATGSRPVELPALPWNDVVVSSSELLALDALPERLVVVGGGYIGLELGTAVAKLGASVTVVEATDRLLPALDPDLGAAVAKGLERLGIAVRLSSSAVGLTDDRGAGLVVQGPDGAEEVLPADRVLVAVGRTPVVEGWGLEGLDLDRTGRFVAIDDRCATSMAGVYAVGDLTGEPMLAHRATAQGELVAELVAGGTRRWDVRCIPAVVFTDPEVVTVGEASGGAEATVTGRGAFGANGRAHATGDAHGFVKVVARADDHVVAGIHGVGRDVAELSSTFALAIEMGARLEDLVGTVFAHPTRGEALQAAAADALRRLRRPARTAV